MEKKTVVIGVCGGIAAYKACDIVSKLKKLDLDVHVIMTKSACEFVAPMTFQTLSQNFAITDMFEEPKTWDVEHISLAKKADTFLIVPATANVIGKIAGGIADDMLTTTVMATKAPVIIAPAMNTNMYENPIVQDNIEKLKGYGYKFVEPTSGRLACGDLGRGKLADVDDIVHEVYVSLFGSDDLRGMKITVTAGPTVEDIDPVRYITNRSSGKMGYSIAKRAIMRGAEVTLISGPTSLDRPRGVHKFVQTSSAESLYNAVNDNFEDCDALIQSAAVADYKPKNYSKKKVKKKDGDLSIELARTKDVAKEMGKIKADKVLVGFAAETNDLLQNAQRKIESKNLDFIVANDLTKEGAGFNTDTNIVKIIDADGNMEDYPKMSKEDVADIILDKVKAIIENQ